MSGFLFLRFFNPAILGPKLFAVKDEHPDQKTERTLKLVAKVITGSSHTRMKPFTISLCVQVLQNISNLSPEMDAKEPYMQPLGYILPRSVERIKDFIQQLVQIDQKEGENQNALFPGYTELLLVFICLIVCVLIKSTLLYC